MCRGVNAVELVSLGQPSANRGQESVGKCPSFSRLWWENSKVEKKEKKNSKMGSTQITRGSVHLAHEQTPFVDFSCFSVSTALLSHLPNELPHHGGSF